MKKEIKPDIYITYEMVFDEEPLSISDYLKEIDRKWLIDTALYIIYSEDKLKYFSEYTNRFFSKQNHPFVKGVLDKLNKYLTRNNNDIANFVPHSYFILSESTGLELLKQVFSIQNFSKSLPQVFQEQYLFKAILLINKELGKTNVSEEFDANENYTDLFYAKSLVCNFINNHERLILKPGFLSFLQIIKGYYFFKFCEDPKLQQHIDKFLENNGFNSWKQYIYNAIHLILYPLKNETGHFPIIKLNERLEGYKYLHAHSFSIDSIIPIEKNIDYTFFKTYPLIELDKRTFLPIGAIFCINHLYKSVYFELRKINEEFDDTIKIKGFLQYITTEFSERYLFDRFIENTLNKQRGIKLSDDDCKNINPRKNNRPDYYFRNGNNVFLFENKDIKIANFIVNSKDYGQIGNELNKKLIEKAGVNQLVKHIVAIEKRQFVWDANLPKHPRIYPILVIDDSSLCVPGLNYILNDAFQSQMKNQDVKIKVFPLVVIELDTLIAYANYFKTGRIKLKDLIDEYYKYIKRCKVKVAPDQILYEVYHRFFPFYTFVSKEIMGQPYEETLFNQICNELK